MPYKSAAQRAYFNAQRGKKVPASVVDEFNAASKGEGKLPQHTAKKKDTGLGNFLKGKGGR